MKSSVFIRAVLVFATVLAPFTLLRVPLVGSAGLGVAELLIILLFLSQAVKGVRLSLLRQFPLTAFWSFFLFMNLLGAAANLLLRENPSGTWAGMAFDLAAYLLIFMTCFTLERLASHEGLDPARLLREVFFCASVVLSLLYVASLYTSTLFGLPLEYYGRFRPFAENVHQVSMFLVPLPFFGLVVLGMNIRLPLKMLAAGLIAMLVVMTMHTGSTKAEMALPVSGLVVGYAWSLKRLGRPYFLIVNSVFLAGGIVASTRADFIGIATRFFVENDQSAARQNIYQRGLITGFDSFLLGRGPGQHVQYAGGSYADAHQTVLTVFLQAGIIGVIALTILSFHAVKRAAADPFLVGALSGVAVYALGGDILRRLPIWIVLFIIVHYPVADTTRTVRMKSPIPRRRGVAASPWEPALPRAVYPVPVAPGGVPSRGGGEGWVDPRA